MTKVTTRHQTSGKLTPDKKFRNGKCPKFEISSTLLYQMVDIGRWFYIVTEGQKETRDKKMSKAVPHNTKKLPLFNEVTSRKSMNARNQCGLQFKIVEKPGRRL